MKAMLPHGVPPLVRVRIHFPVEPVFVRERRKLLVSWKFDEKRHADPAEVADLKHSLQEPSWSDVVLNAFIADACDANDVRISKFLPSACGSRLVELGSRTRQERKLKTRPFFLLDVFHVDPKFSAVGQCNPGFLARQPSP